MSALLQNLSVDGVVHYLPRLDDLRRRNDDVEDGKFSHQHGPFGHIGALRVMNDVKVAADQPARSNPRAMYRLKFGKNVLGRQCAATAISSHESRPRPAFFSTPREDDDGDMTAKSTSVGLQKYIQLSQHLADACSSSILRIGRLSARFFVVAGTLSQGALGLRVLRAQVQDDLRPRAILRRHQHRERAPSRPVRPSVGVGVFKIDHGRVGHLSSLRFWQSTPPEKAA